MLHITVHPCHKATLREQAHKLERALALNRGTNHLVQCREAIQRLLPQVDHEHGQYALHTEHTATTHHLVITVFGLPYITITQQ